ncbi:hypothetical protein Ocin01_16684 [Orchesella cincta]|uniref:DNA-directed DNA polymerase n=1 Tax=Orchesella cincta TaxID=48709 RepID=A0A1D2MAH9_ORCCI|nr:hypothetical protein Ocin01_16684 [Orchesella cincta]
MEKGDEGTPEYEEIERYENSTLKTCYSIYDFADLFNDVSFEILGYIELFEQYGSGWSLKSVRGLDIRLGRLPPIGGSCFVELPKNFCSKRCFINVRNEDQMCFKWAFLSIMHYKDVKKNRQRWNYYQKYEHLYDFSSVSYPASLRDVEKFNKYLEAKKICVNIFGLEKVKSDYQTVVRKMAKNSTNPLFKKVNLLLYDDSKQATSHYLGITDISRLFGKHNSSRKEFCYNCLNLVSMKQYKLHTSICTRFKTQNVKMPKKDNTKKFISFDQYEKLIPHEYVIYADLEALCIPTNFKKPDSQFSYTHKYQKHTPSGYAFAVFHNASLVENLKKPEPGLRGGTSMIVTREAIANNKYMENYNHQKPNSFLCYFDKTNLYVWICLYGGFTLSFRSSPITQRFSVDAREIETKGIRKSVVKKSFRHDKFVDTFKQQQRSYAVMNVIRSYKHTLHTVEIRKSGLTCFDSKRYILPSGVNTLAYNHFLLKPLKRIV